LETQITTTSSINLESHLLPCGCCFVVSLKGIPICQSADPVVDAALILKEAGVADETTIRIKLEGSDVAAKYTLRDLISESEGEAEDLPKSDPWSKRQLH
jgi:hypothetical protein